jgi:hypothetical protein
MSNGALIQALQAAIDRSRGDVPLRKYLGC